MVRSKLFVATALTVLAVGSTACASKKFVRTSVGEVNTKVDSLGRSVEETQERTRRNEGRIGEVDTKAQAAADSAAAANSAAAKAAAAAGAVDAKADAIDRANRKLVFEVVLNEDQGNFKFGQTALPDEAKMKIDEMVNQLKQDAKNIFIEIEGHTDNVGTPQTNEKIGLERAQAVERYLYEQFQIPLHKMNVISYGESKPVGPNKTRTDRAKNRRVVIRVLA